MDFIEPEKNVNELKKEKNHTESERKIKAVKGGKHYRYKIPFHTSGNMVHCESTIERDYVRILDFDKTILEVIHQPLLINFKYKGRKRRYFPDFKVVTNTGDIWIVEVKSQEKLNYVDNVCKYIVGELYCKQRGWSYRIVTDCEIRKGFLQNNLSLLRAHGSQLVEEKLLIHVYSQLSKMKVCSIESLRRNCTDLTDNEFYSAIYSLILNHKVFGDLKNNKLDGDFQVSIN